MSRSSASQRNLAGWLHGLIHQGVTIMRRLTASLNITLVILAGSFGLSGCSLSGDEAIDPVRNYNGTASVGDFLTISVDPLAQTIQYSDDTSGQGGTVPYTINADGTYALYDPDGNLLAAYEIPGYGLVIQAAHTGPNQDTPSLITALDSGQIALGTFAGQGFNTMQFRTTDGGIDVGSMTVDAQGLASQTTYRPIDTLGGTLSGFSGSTLDLGRAMPDRSGTFLSIANGANTEYVFGTANGSLAIDTTSGAVLGLQQAAAKDFDPASAGTYTALYYEKTGSATAADGTESGTLTLGSATLTVSATGDVTMADSLGNLLAQGTLAAVADTPYLYGSDGQLRDPCFGLFTFRSTVNGVQQDVFVSFKDRSAIFSSFATAQPSTPGQSYDYFYGTGLK
jgi:hypothetical protein